MIKLTVRHRFFSDILFNPYYHSTFAPYDHRTPKLIMANEGRKGPVWLDIPLDIQGQIMPSPNKNSKLNLRFIEPLTISNYSYPNKKLKSVFEKINSSNRPVLMLGEEIRNSHAEHLVDDLISLLGIPVVTEWNAHDLVNQDSPFQSGRPGHNSATQFGYPISSRVLAS